MGALIGSLGATADSFLFRQCGIITEIFPGIFSWNSSRLKAKLVVA
jgi:hypothetical protein